MMKLPCWLIIICIVAVTGCNEDATQRQNTKSLKSSRGDVIMRLATATESSGDLASAEKQFIQATKASGNSPETLLELAAFYGRNQQKKNAIDSLEQAKSYHPENTEILRALANAYINNSETQKGLDILQSAIHLDNKNPLLYNNQGVAYDILDKPAEAQASYLKAIQLDPDNVTAYTLNLSMSYIVSHDYNKAIALLMPYQDGPNSTPKIRQTLALAYGLKGDSEKALALGLKDLNSEEAHENLKFYRSIKDQKGKKQSVQQRIPALPTAEFVAIPETTPSEETVEHAEVVSVEVKPAPTKQVDITPPKTTKESRKEPEEVTPPEKPSSIVKPSAEAKPITPEVEVKQVITNNGSGELVLPRPVLKPDK